MSEDGANLLARSTPIAFSVSGKFWVNNHAHVLRFTDRSLQRFVELYLESISVKHYVTGAAQPKLNKAALNSIPIPVPPLLEQRRIARILDEAFDAIAKAKANAEKNRQNARALFESHLHSVFTQPQWDQMRLRQVADTISTGPFGTMLHKSDYVPEGIPLVNPVNIVGSRIVPSSQMMVGKGTRDRLSAYSLRVGDIVVARRGELGRCALVTDTEAGWLCGTGSFIVRLASTMDPSFFVSFFTSKKAREHLQRTAIGATMSNLNHTILGDLPVVVPPIAEQKSIIERVSEIREQLNFERDPATDPSGAPVTLLGTFGLD